MWSRLYPHGVTAASGVWHGRPLWDPGFHFFFLEELQIRSFPQSPKTGADFCVCVSELFPMWKAKLTFTREPLEKDQRTKKKKSSCSISPSLIQPSHASSAARSRMDPHSHGTRETLAACLTVLILLLPMSHNKAAGKTVLCVFSRVVFQIIP